MSMKPGARTRPPASTTVDASGAAPSGRMAAMRPPSMVTLARTPGTPVPSTTVAPRMSRSVTRERRRFPQAECTQDLMVKRRCNRLDSLRRAPTAMKIGLLLPQGYFNEFEGWHPVAAWERVLEIARLGERLGFDALWTGEHVLAKWDPEGIAFDCVTLHTAVAAAVPRVDIGFGVINSTFRNPAMTAKMAATLDTMSGGRLILGPGAGV